MGIPCSKSSSFQKYCQTYGRINVFLESTINVVYSYNNTYYILSSEKFISSLLKFPLLYQCPVINVHTYYTDLSLAGSITLPYLENPNCWHITLASLLPNVSLQRFVQEPSTQTCTLPYPVMLEFISLTSPRLQSSKKK